MNKTERNWQAFLKQFKSSITVTHERHEALHKRLSSFRSALQSEFLRCRLPRREKHKIQIESIEQALEVVRQTMCDLGIAGSDKAIRTHSQRSPVSQLSRLTDLTKTADSHLKFRDRPDCEA